MPSPSTSSPKTNERYGLIEEVHFTINRNKQGWFITEINSGGAPYRTHGPLEGPINRLDAMSYLVTTNTLSNQ